ncbi:MAG: aminoacetone oxidase family FAD-binding enzyme, partial [Mucinivorans sp.]
LTNTKALDEFTEKIKSGGDFCKIALQEFDNQKVISFFNSIGIATITERGARVFPESGKAFEVAPSFTQWAQSKGVIIRNNTPAKQLIIESGQIVGIKTDNEIITTKYCILATGGVSYPSTGSTGDGHQMAWEVGHTIVPLRPALVALEIENHLKLKGLLLKNVLSTLVINGKSVDNRFGEVEFTDKGLGGATVIQLSRQAVDSIIENKSVSIIIDTKPALSNSQLHGRIERELRQLPNATLKVLLQKLIPSTLHNTIVSQANISINTHTTKLTENQIEVLISTLKALEFKILNYRPFTEAIITAGGVSLDEVSHQTMESKKVKGLYFSGELLDIDADTGGYNIQLALSTAVLAANSIVKAFK